jgi:phage portal protein BeeE
MKYPLRPFGVQSYKGDSPVLLNSETIAGWLVMEQHLSRFFGRGAKPSGVLESQRSLSPEGVKLLRTQFDATFGGYANSSQTIVLEEGMQWKPVSMTSVDAQFQELRRAQLFQVCRIWRIPPLLMQDAEKSGMGSTAETLARHFVTYTLSPHMEAWEQALAISLLTRDERRKFYLQHDLAEFTRAESQTRWQAYIAGVTNGVLSPNEVRSMESLPPREGGDEYRMPLNLGRTNQYDGQNSHIEDPNQTLLAPVKTSRAQRRARDLPPSAWPASFGELAHYLDRNPNRLRLAAPQPKGSIPKEDQDHAKSITG